jgi:putative transposase
MPSHLKRFHESGQTHFITFGCYHRRRSFSAPEAARIFEAALERVRRAFELNVYGYVMMPDHVHILVSEPQRATLADAIKSLKQGVSRRLTCESAHFWQKRYYDFNIRDSEQFTEKLRYIHRNPVARDLCERPEHWEWSSFNHYRNSLRRNSSNRIRMGGQKTRTRCRTTCSDHQTTPLKPTTGLNGPPACDHRKL